MYIGNGIITLVIYGINVSTIMVKKLGIQNIIWVLVN